MVALFAPSCSPAQNGDLAGGKADAYARAREEMVRTQIAARGITDRRVLDAMRSVPRHLFMPNKIWYEAYADGPLPIGYGQTISQPYIVGYMTDELKLSPNDRVLEIGTGSGYQAAVLSKLVKEVYSIEIVEPLATLAARTLSELGYANVKVKSGDGYKGWPEKAPFDAIMLTAAPSEIPDPLIEQLRVGGKLIAPVGTFWQSLVLVTRTPTGIMRQTLLPVRFVPMTGKAEKAS